MHIEVRYHSRSGNTKKIANAIAETFDIKAESIDMPVSQATDILFLGGALYAGHIDKKLSDYIEKLPTDDLIKRVVIFDTAFGPDSIFEETKELLDKKGIPVDEKHFHCRAKFLFFKRKHPDYQDIANAVTFAKQFHITQA